MALIFCSRCGRQSQEGDLSHFTGPCAKAKAVHEGQLVTESGEHVRCPVAGCKFKTKLVGKAEVVRAKFDYHLNWHVENAVMGTVEGAPVSPLQVLHVAAINAGCPLEDVEAFKRVVSRLLEWSSRHALPFKLSTVLNTLANMQKLREDPVLRKQFEEHVRAKGKEFANHWLDNHAAQAGLNAAAVEQLKKELNK